MRLLFFELKNYAGITNGMNLETISIDFSRCKNTITLICGMNGVGKSTLLKAMNPLPDGSENYSPGMEAHKKMTIEDNGSIFEIYIVSPVNSSMNRTQSKAYIRKNGVELNETGNITSYKDIIFNEFELDANYITLSKLSSDDRGLATKTPAERKKYIAAMLNSIDTYNSINKALSQRVSVFKSHINNLDDKVKAIGDISTVEAALQDADARLKKRQEDKEELLIQKAVTAGYISKTDPTGELQKEYQEIYDKIVEVNNSIETTKAELPEITTSQSSNPAKFITEAEDMIIKLSSTIEAKKVEKDTILAQRSEAEKKVDIDTQKLDNLENGFEITNLASAVTDLRRQAESLQKNLDDAQIVYEGISKDEYLLCMEILRKTRDSIKNLCANVDETIVTEACEFIRDGHTSLDKDIDALETSDMLILDDLSKLRIDIDKNDRLLDQAGIVNDRPEKCRIDSCPFIKDAISISRRKNEILADNDKIQNTITFLEGEHKQTQDHIARYKAEQQFINGMNTILSVLEANSRLISKFPSVDYLLDTKNLMFYVEKGSTFREIDLLLDQADTFDDADALKSIKEKLVTLEADYKVAKTTENSINELKKSIEEQNQIISESFDKIEKVSKEIETLEESLKYQKTTKETLELWVFVNDKVEDLKKKKLELKAQYEKIKGDIAQIKAYVDKINIIDTSLVAVTQELPQLERDRDQLSYDLTNLRSYYTELNEYKEKYNVVNVLKKYSSPTTGIQTIYMDMYMGKTLTLANELLQMMFGGEYRLLPYVINEAEFRIPFVGNGLPVDDISSGSTSQLCIIGTIMNLVLLYQASTKYNIITLDEIDGGLDSHNRYDFIPTLYKLIDVLHIDQLVMISHNIEADLSNVDVIKLKGYEDDALDMSNVNVIYDYRGESSNG